MKYSIFNKLLLIPVKLENFHSLYCNKPNYYNALCISFLMVNSHYLFLKEKFLLAILYIAVSLALFTIMLAVIKKTKQENSQDSRPNYTKETISKGKELNEINKISKILTPFYNSTKSTLSLNDFLLKMKKSELASLSSSDKFYFSTSNKKLILHTLLFIQSNYFKNNSEYLKPLFKNKSKVLSDVDDIAIDSTDFNYAKSNFTRKNLNENYKIIKQLKTLI